jgi:hypothetical protein
VSLKLDLLLGDPLELRQRGLCDSLSLECSSGCNLGFAQGGTRLGSLHLGITWSTGKTRSNTCCSLGSPLADAQALLRGPVVFDDGESLAGLMRCEPTIDFFLPRWLGNQLARSRTHFFGTPLIWTRYMLRMDIKNTFEVLSSTRTQPMLHLAFRGGFHAFEDRRSTSQD